MDRFVVTGARTNPVSVVAPKFVALTQRITAAIPIAKAIIDGRKAMSVLDKLDLIADRRADMNVSLAHGADKVLERYAEVALKGERAFDRHHAQLDAEENAIDRTDAAIDKMSNSLGNSNGSLDKPKTGA